MRRQVIRCFVVTGVCALLLGACGLTGTAPREVTLAVLVGDQAGYDGRMVTTEGVVRTHDDPRHYWIEDDDLNRVELIPDDEVVPLLGERVRVTGRFRFRDDEGRRIEIEQIERLSTTPHASGG